MLHLIPLPPLSNGMLNRGVGGVGLQDPLARGWDSWSVGWLQSVGSLSGSRMREGGFYPPRPPQPSLEHWKKEGLPLPSVLQGWLWNKAICGPAPGAEPNSFDASGEHMFFVGVFFCLAMT